MYLLWRIQNGGGPEGTGVKVVVVLIGSNDIARMYYEFKARPWHEHGCLCCLCCCCCGLLGHFIQTVAAIFHSH